MTICKSAEKEVWLKGIQEEGYKWVRASDLLGFKSPVCKAYDVNGIPTLFLLDGEGNSCSYFYFFSTLLMKMVSNSSPRVSLPFCRQMASILPLAHRMFSGSL